MRINWFLGDYGECKDLPECPSLIGAFARRYCSIKKYKTMCPVTCNICPSRKGRPIGMLIRDINKHISESNYNIF